MPTYKDFQKIVIGYSNIASLIFRGPDKVAEIDFGIDECYDAYLVYGPAEIGSHYRKVFECDHWVWIYDDDCCIKKLFGHKIFVYRAGMMGCIIQIID